MGRRLPLRGFQLSTAKNNRINGVMQAAPQYPGRHTSIQGTKAKTEQEVRPMQKIVSAFFIFYGSF